MFCYQCEQTAKGEGCTVMGVCGKSHEIASLQALLVEALKGLALFAVEGRKVGIVITTSIYSPSTRFFRRLPTSTTTRTGSSTTCARPSI